MRSALQNKNVLVLLALMLIGSQWLTSHHVHDLADHQKEHLECFTCSQRGYGELATLATFPHIEHISFRHEQSAPPHQYDVKPQVFLAYRSRAPPLHIV